jgi:hypothetical protein
MKRALNREKEGLNLPRYQDKRLIGNKKGSNKRFTKVCVCPNKKEEAQRCAYMY